MSCSDWLPHDLCADLRDDCDCDHDRRHDHRGRRDPHDCHGCDGHRDLDDMSGGLSGDCDCDHDRRDGRDRRHRRRRRRAIRVGRVTVDCTPVTFRTPGQAVNVVSCPVSHFVFSPHFPHVPCVKTVNLPPVQTPAQSVFFPPGFFPFTKF